MLYPVRAQHQDFRTWIDISLEGELFNLIDFEMVPELRLWDNSTRIDGILGEADISVPVTKFLRPGVYYRYEMDVDRQLRYNNIHRFGVYAELDERLGNFRLKYRAMYLQEYRNWQTDELGTIPYSMHRHKISVKYRQKGWDITPGIAVEGFFMIKPTWIDSREKFRLTAGIRYKLTKKINLTFDYKFQQEYYERNPLTSHILCVGASFEL